MASPVKNKTSEYFDTRQITDTILTELQVGIRYVIEGEDMQNQTDELRRQNQTGLYDKSKPVKRRCKAPNSVLMEASRPSPEKPDIEGASTRSTCA